MDGRPTWTYCGEAGDYVVPNVLSPRDLVSRPDIMDETVQIHVFSCMNICWVSRKLFELETARPRVETYSERHVKF